MAHTFSIRTLFFLLISISSILSTTTYGASWWSSSSYNHGNMLRSIPDLAQAALSGDVLFIDTREPEEYKEGHIPFSVNYRLVDLDRIKIENLASYRYVVPYCLKDFRGYEVARELRSKGLANVVMMSPSGMRGWEKLGFPIVTNNIDAKEKLANALSSLDSNRLTGTKR